MLNRILYPFVYAFFYALGSLPFWFLYRLSDFFFVLLFYVFGYRKKVAYDNLKQCFPEKSEAEIRQILKDNYVHLADMFLEFFKGMNISEKEVRKRLQDLRPDITAQIDQSPIGIYALTSHCGNFEWTSALFALIFKQKKICAIYQPLNNLIFERLIVSSREKRGAKMIPMKNASVVVPEYIQNNYFLGTLCDQSPGRAEKLYFTKFFNIPTATHTKFADAVLSNQFPVCYMKISKVKRGYYSLEFVPIDLRPFLPYSPENALRFVDFYNEILEAHIRENPAQWLWTHKKWKHRPNEKDLLSPLLTQKPSAQNI